MHTEKDHRKRVRKRFLDEGLDHFDEVHALELLLFYAIPQKDTKPLARQLIDHFGSFYQVLEAMPEELMEVNGVGENTAVYLSMINAVDRYLQVNRKKNTKILKDIDDYGAYLVNHFVGRRNETVYLLCLDAKCKVRGCQKLWAGDVNATNLPIGRVVEAALAAIATSVVLAHNHPSGIAVPSREDVAVTRQAAIALGSFGIILADHIVVADDDFVSMVQSGLFRPGDYC